MLPNDSLVTLRLRTLRMASNGNLTLAPRALAGQESSLRNLVLSDCGLRAIPQAISKLRSLAFLDMAQNNIRQVDAAAIAGLDSLAALNLERNIVRQLEPSSLAGVADTLSSLSLLNNLLTEFPAAAINSLNKLRVSGENRQSRPFFASPVAIQTSSAPA